MKNYAFLVAGVIVLIFSMLGIYHYLATVVPPEIVPKSTPFKSTPPPEVLDGPAEEVFDVRATEFSYSKEFLVIEAGKEIAFALTNIGKLNHDFVLEGAGISTKVLKPNESEIITFRVDTPGTYSYFCSVPGHRDAGMEGMLVVK